MELRAPEPPGGRRGHRGGAIGAVCSGGSGWGGARGGKGTELLKAPRGPGKETPRSTVWVAPSWMALYPGAPGHSRTKPHGLALRRLCDLEAAWHCPVSISSRIVKKMLILLSVKKKKRIELNET